MFDGHCEHGEHKWRVKVTRVRKKSSGDLERKFKNKDTYAEALNGFIVLRTRWPEKVEESQYALCSRANFLEEFDDQADEWRISCKQWISTNSFPTAYAIWLKVLLTEGR